MSKFTCGFNVAWVGYCEEEVAEKGDRCEKHNVKCCSCGEPATHDCEHTGALVCGAPLCDNCEGKQNPNAGYGFMGFGGHSHGKKNN